MRGDDRGSATARAVAMLRAGQADAAFRHCVEALAACPADAGLNALAAAAASQAGRHAEAADHAGRSLDGRPDHAPTLLLLGRALRAQGRRTEAASAFERAARREPGTPAAAFLLCATWLQEGDPRASAMLEGLLARFPAHAPGWEEVGLVLAGLGKSAAALACFTRALRAAPSAALAMRVGSILKDLGRLREAAAAFGEAADRDAGSARARFLRGLCLQDAGDPDAAAEAYRAALTLDPMLAEAAVNLGTVLQDAGDLDGAKAAYGRALRARPDTFGRIAQAMTTSRRGELWLDLGKLRRSLAGRGVAG